MAVDDIRLANKAAGLLARNPIFRGAPEAELGKLTAGGARIEHYARGEVIFSPDKYENSLGLVITGALRVAKGRVHISELGRGEIFGAVALFGEKDYYVTEITAKTDAQVLLLGREAITEYMHTRPVFAENYIRYLCGRIYFLNAKIDSFTAGAADDGLAAYLLRNADESGEIPHIRIKNRTELARKLNISRASLYRAIAALESRGAIRCEDNDIIIADKEKLL